MGRAVETLIILDYGSQYTQLIARRARELGVFSLILPHDTLLEEIKRYNPKGVILSGGPNSVYLKKVPQLNKALLTLGLPMLGICYGLQLLTTNLGGTVEPAPRREYGLAKIQLKTKSLLFAKHFDNSKVWMSHGDHVVKLPAGFKITAMSEDIICAVENPTKKFFGLQFHPEVSHTQFGIEILQKFLSDICHFSQDWTAKSFVASQITKIREQVGTDNVICALSGGVDSSVAATLVDRAIGQQQICIFVDTGLLRSGEYEQVLEIYKKTGLNVKSINAKKRFLIKLKGLTKPEDKRKIIGSEFIKIFEEEAREIKQASCRANKL